MKITNQLVFILFSILIGFNPVFAQWVLTDSLNTHQILSLAVSSDQTKLIAGTNGNGVLYSANNGGTWTSANRNLNGGHVRALAVSGSKIFAGTDSGLYLAESTTLENGTWAGWSQINSGLSTKNVLSLAVSSDGARIFAATSNGIFTSSNNGGVWTPASNGLSRMYVTALAVSGSKLFAATIGGGVYESASNGSSWTQVNSGLTNTNVYTITASGTNIFIGTDDGVFLSTGNGIQWHAVNAGLTNIDVNCLVANGQYIYVGTFSGGVFYSTNNGTLWSSFNSGMTDNIINALIVGGKDLFAGSTGVWKRSISGNIGDGSNISLIQFSLGQNYPNPFNPSTNFSFSIPSPSFVSLRIFDVVGREICVVLNEEMKAGSYTRQWSPKGLPSGVYFYRLQAGAYTETKRLLLLK
ncbi:MAG TPA: T9SS type A sorting domain-containing protein [Bacteroidota bacterium]|nr:T9SS type A sorting domain-containing protein [Bacteroidota bacterium]